MLFLEENGEKKKRFYCGSFCVALSVSPLYSNIDSVLNTQQSHKIFLWFFLSRFLRLSTSLGFAAKERFSDIFSGFSTCFFCSISDFLKLLFYWIVKKGFRFFFVLLGIREKLFIASNICGTVWVFDWEMFEKMKIGKPSRKTTTKKGIHMEFVVLLDVFTKKTDQRPPRSH